MIPVVVVLADSEKSHVGDGRQDKGRTVEGWVHGLEEGGRRCGEGYDETKVRR